MIDDSSPQIVVVGSLNMDLAAYVPYLPRPGETLTVDRMLVAPGGKGGNQAIAAARLGGRVALIACVGGDEFGGRLRESLAAEGIDCSGVMVSAASATGIAMVAVDEGGSNSIVTVRGSNGDLTPERVGTQIEHIVAARMIVCDLTVPRPTVEYALATAKASGVSVLLNASPVESALPPRLLEQTDYLVVNEVEATTLCARALHSVDDAKAIARALREAGARHVLVTLGARGVVACFDEEDGARAEFFPAAPVVAVDTTAAGDTFAGAFATAIVAGASKQHAVAFAQAAAATCVTRRGAAPSIPYLHEIDVPLLADDAR
jgi:ribokinase